MISRIRRAARAQRCGVIIKHRGDTRYARGNVIATHANVRQASSLGDDTIAAIRVVAADTLAEVAVTEFVIGIDEGQFYPDLIEMCELWRVKGAESLSLHSTGIIPGAPSDECVNSFLCANPLKNDVEFVWFAVAANRRSLNELVKAPLLLKLAPASGIVPSVACASRARR
jgi:hypothetical protein